MANKNDNVEHVCETCRFHREDLPGTIDQDDIKVYERIQTMINNAQQAANPSSLEALPGDISAENKAIYMQAALKNEADAKLLLAEWWGEMKNKYHVPDSAKVDNIQGVFYQCIDDDGVVCLDGLWQPKKD